MSNPPKLGPAFAEALAWANEVHGPQVRKGTSVPYISHLLAVTSLVLEAGGDEPQAVAALLHDVLEDVDGVTPEVVRTRFGARVAEIVEGCSDTGLDGGVPSAEARGPGNSFRRKEAYLRHLAGVEDAGVLRVSLADKLHNARAILADHRQLGDALWSRFNVGKLGQLWYYRELVAVFAHALPGDAQAAELASVVDALRRRSGDVPDAELDEEAATLRTS